MKIKLFIYKNNNNDLVNINKLISLGVFMLLLQKRAL